MLHSKFLDVMSHEGVVSVVTWSEGSANVSNTWNSYLRITEDGRLLIPAAGMNKTEKNIKINDQVKITLGSKEVQGLWAMGTGFLVDGKANFIYEGADFDMMKASFPFLNRVISITIKKVTQTV